MEFDSTTLEKPAGSDSRSRSHSRRWRRSRSRSWSRSQDNSRGRSPHERWSRSPLKVRRRSNSLRGRSAPHEERVDRNAILKLSDKVMQLPENRAGAVIGRGGHMKRRVQQISGAVLQYRSDQVFFYGSSTACERAYLYCQLILMTSDPSENKTEVTFDANRSDVSMLTVPTRCIKHITGATSKQLREIETRWKTLMFFGTFGQTSYERLAIFGARAGRRGAELQVMGLVEKYAPGFFLDKKGKLFKPFDQPGDDNDDDWGYETKVLGTMEIPYVYGTKGVMRDKLATAANCIIEFVGNTAFFAGTSRARTLGRDYVTMLLLRRINELELDEHLDRDDCVYLMLPRKTWIVLKEKRVPINFDDLGRIEHETETITISEEKDLHRSIKDKITVMVCGHSRAFCREAKRRIANVGEKIRSRNFDRSRSPVHV
eukprot:gnl/MRDRNA2_/MRDRNA2_21817_c0_seq1.p1 gnl/MRDRNA2_/MRDRNA2_21817_c0~~gnl/MRDRNA2_/MRDRNA2_21817_c0_seq1.p1  ORF type:complete len:430 (+),score=28.50 gnl/MRDRNA2_/MRDRNA2_21817_c0_seq1:3-1292(+)